MNHSMGTCKRNDKMEEATFLRNVIHARSILVQLAKALACILRQRKGSGIQISGLVECKGAQPSQDRK